MKSWAKPLRTNLVYNQEFEMRITEIGVKDFKAVQGKLDLKFSPISILIGQNSSGKSSILKSILLLKESLNQTRDFSQLHFSARNLMLGSFESVVNNVSEDGRIAFVFPLELQYVETQFYLHLVFKKGTDSSEEDGILSEMRVESMDGSILYAGYTNLQTQKEFKESYKSLYNKLKKHPDDKPYGIDMSNLNEVETGYKSMSFYNPDYFYNVLNNQINAFIHNPPIELDTEDMGRFVTDDEVFDQSKEFNNVFSDPLKQDGSDIPENFLKEFAKDPGLLKFYEGILEGEGLFKTVKTDYSQELPRKQTDEFSRNPQNVFKTTFYLDEESVNLLSNIKDFRPRVDTVKNKIKNLYSYEHIAVELSSKGNFVYNKMFKENILNAIEKVIVGFERVEYLSPYRGITERIFMSGMSRSHLSEILYEFSKSAPSAVEGDFINRWLNEFGIGNKISLKRYEGSATSVFVEKDGHQILLADLGYGYHQLLPIILQIVLNVRKNDAFDDFPGLVEPSTILIEEPESNLHPNLQSKLADLFVDASKRFRIRFIVETHSEYLVRKMQYLTATGEVLPEGTSIYYFNGNDGSGLPPVSRIDIQEDGSLSSDFGPGFFDEADNLAINLFNFKMNKN